MKKVILLIVILLAAFLRLYQLGSYPALNADEAAIGYNAYSLIQTGKDEHANPWPIHFQSFNDFKPGLYVYLVLPFVKFFGLNEWAVRIPGALLGVATVFLVFLLVKSLFKNEMLALTSSFFLAISPWHIHFSRGGWEVTVATFFITLGLFLFLKALKTKKYYLLSFISFTFSLYTYHAARAIVPLLGFALFFVYRKQILRERKAVIKAAAIAAILLIPLVFDLTKGNLYSRATGVGLFADPGPFNRTNEQRGEHIDLTSLPVLLIHNKAVNYSLAFFENWTEHFSGEFLFMSGDKIQRNRVPDIGQMYLFDLLFLLAGFVAIARNPKGWKLIIAWLFIAPTAAALTFQSPHALRSQNMVIPLVIISSFGLLYLSRNLHKIFDKKTLNLIFVVFILAISWGFSRYLHMYWVHMAKEYPFSSQYGVKQLVNYVDKIESQYENIVVTDRYDQPYILFLFYQKFPPNKFQEDHVLTARDNFGFSTVRSFDKYRFQGIDFDEIRPIYPNSLIIGTEEEIPDTANIINTIYFPNGQPAFRIVAN